MSGYNSVTILGNLVRDPQTKHLPGGSSVTESGIASSRKFKSASGEAREDTVFVDIAAFGRQGEILQQYGRKGKQMLVVGRLKLDQWEKDGQKRSKLSVVVENFQFVGGKDDSGGGGQSVDRSSDQTRRPAPSSRPAAPAEDNEFKVDDIPFFWEGRHRQPV